MIRRLFYALSRAGSHEEIEAYYGGVCRRGDHNAPTFDQAKRDHIAEMRQRMPTFVF